MSVNYLGEIIRTKKDYFVTPNISGLVGVDEVEVFFENFRKLKQDSEFFLFYQFENQIYFPIWFEFRSINNNLLFLFEEYEIGNFNLLQRILNSSLKKEEFFECQMMALVYHTKVAPSFSHLLSGFIIEPEFRIDVHEVLPG